MKMLRTDAEKRASAEQADEQAQKKHAKMEKKRKQNLYVLLPIGVAVLGAAIYVIRRQNRTKA